MRLSFNPSLEQVAALLRQCGLPDDDIRPEYLSDFVIAHDAGDPVGVAGLQVMSSVGLVRSVGVAPSHRAQGLGAQLLAAVEARAGERGVARLFLLTNDAQGFFARQGYTESSRCSAPAEIQGCSQFSSSCCGAATLMEKRAEA